MRRYSTEIGSWRIETYPYDAALRRIGDAGPTFDKEGRMIASGAPGSERHVVRSYDAQGNLMEELLRVDGALSDGSRWDNRYEGTPPRIVAQSVSTVRAGGEATPAYRQHAFRYDATGHLEEERIETGSRATTRSFTWINGRIKQIRERLDPHPSHPTVVMESVETFEYDSLGRLKAYVRDGDTPSGEGSLADRKPDQRETFHYDASGRLERVERDGQVGDVNPEAPDGSPDAVALLSPACDPLTKLAPRLFDLPELYLPATITTKLP